MKNCLENRPSIDLVRSSDYFAFNNICQLAFNVYPGLLRSKGITTSDFTIAFDSANYLLPFMWKVKKILKIRTVQELKNCISIVHEYMENIILSRLAGNRGTNKDLLSRFIGGGYTLIEYLPAIMFAP